MNWCALAVTGTSCRADPIEVHLTEELPEILYLGPAFRRGGPSAGRRFFCSTGKLVPGRPFPRRASSNSVAGSPPPAERVGPPRRRRKTSRPLSPEIDGTRVSPLRLRGPQYRGLAEPYSVILDFELPEGRPQVLRPHPGGSRLAAAWRMLEPPTTPNFHSPSRRSGGNPQGWKPLDVTVGAPAGKTKSIVWTSPENSRRGPAGCD